MFYYFLINIDLTLFKVDIKNDLHYVFLAGPKVSICSR